MTPMLWFLTLFPRTSRDLCPNHRRYSLAYGQKWYQCMRFIAVAYPKHSAGLILFFFHYAIGFILLSNATRYPGSRVIQSVEKFENVFNTYRVCLPLVTQVSSVHSITFHCNRVQLRCSWANASRNSLFFSEMSDFPLANLRNIPSFCIALRMTDSETKRWSFWLTWMKGIRRVRLELVIKSAMRRLVGVFNKALGSQRRFWGVTRLIAAYCTWYVVQLMFNERRCAAMLSWLQLSVRRVCICRRWFRVNSIARWRWDVAGTGGIDGASGAGFRRSDISISAVDIVVEQV